MKEENKKCWSCYKFKAYYTKGFSCFDKQKNGYCTLHDKITDNQDCCEMWRYSQLSRTVRKDAAIKSLTEILERLTVIEQIIKEEYELDKIKREIDKCLM